MSDCWLLIETSGRVGRIGLARGSNVVRTVDLDASRRHARDLAATVESFLQAERMRPGEVTGVMVSRGPGSYTGLRVGITSAKAFAYATGCKLIAVDTFAAIAQQAPTEARELLVIADALQGLVYRQSFTRSSPVTWMAADELRIDQAEETLPRLPAGMWVSGPGVELHANLIPQVCRLVPGIDREPTVECLYRVGVNLTPLGREELFALEPLYLRGSSAEEKAKAHP
jgi:tRNA threonylcarbamoyladenosine biosynthesis protein TsaB